MRKLIFIFIIISTLGYAQNESGNKKNNPRLEAKIKSLFIYNFTKYIEWPNSKKIKKFKIVVLGDQELIYEEIKLMASIKKYKNTIPIETILIRSPENIPDCEILYTNVKSEFNINKIIDTSIKNNTLLVTEGYGFGETMINFIKNEKNLRFELDENKLKEAKLTVANSLIKIAVKSKKEWNDIIDKMNDAVNDKNVKITNEDLKEILKEYNKKVEAIKKQDSLINVKEELLEQKKIEVKQQEVAISSQKKELYEKQKEYNGLSDKFKEQDAKFKAQKLQLNRQIKLLAQQEKEFANKQKQIEAQELILANQKLKINTQKKELSISNEKIGVQSQEIKKQATTIYIGIGILLFVIGVSFFIYKSYKDKKKSNLLIAKQKELVEEKNKEIMDSIAYAKRIQTAILPPDKLVKQFLTNSFVLYIPKDIVAGDFYWMENVGQKVLFAAADCTGHGVPGAMVSVVCNNGLNRSVREYGLTEPGKILDKTREIVIQEFEKSEEEVKDGMDIALCSLEGNKLEYAGAHNPLWIIRKDAEEVEEIKADKQPIGKFDNPKPHNTHSIELNKGDTFYVFSDGYADQFGGEKGKKFKTANFKRLLLSIQNENIETQRKLINKAFDDWKGNLEQLDDVCVIGVRV